MTDRPIQRVEDIKRAVMTIRKILAGLTFEEIFEDEVRRAAFERYLEIVSEASRFVPQNWKDEHGPEVPWRQIADLGNVLRHMYHRVDPELLWSIFEEDLDPLEAAVDRMLAAFGSA